MMRTHLIRFALFFLLVVYVRAGDYSRYPVLDAYIKEALQNNLALKQKQFDFRKSMQALREARGMFYPSVGIEARYSRAGGGRTIDFPLGDLMNPVYRTLNDILVGIGQPPRPFPTLENQTIPFLREREHETKIRAVQPVFQPALYYNYKIKSNLQQINENEVAVYTRQLIQDVKKAYFNVLKTEYLVRLMRQTAEVVQENLRVSQKLYENDKATREVVYRAETEKSKIEQSILEAKNQRQIAAFYFNFLLNRPLDKAITLIDDLKLDTYLIPEAEQAWREALKRREELKQLEEAVNAADYSGKIAASSFLPALNLVADFGYQGEEYRFGKEDDFWMVSGILQWNLFRGFQDDARRQQAVMEKKKLETQLQEFRMQIRLQVQKAVNRVITAKKSIRVAEDRVNSARESFKIVNKKYKEGMAAHIEYLDARITMTRAEVNRLIAYYEYLIYQAELERVTAALSLENFKEDAK
ncbi:MAG TPA: TolC family protein [Caldithrix abyssi]|uniref:TolC family protein n=1 Tax=Caldithrix abyssi TaxID=187145 RepID=A0A7V4WVM9_CALAY|nr:TolC family protein [Caldithrix abyssi]